MRILTTHVGSLPRADDLVALLSTRERGGETDPIAFRARVGAAVEAVVRKQVTAGLDIVNDDEQGKPDYSTYIKDRLTGFEGESAPPIMGADMKDVPSSRRAGRRRRSRSGRRDGAKH